MRLLYILVLAFLSYCKLLACNAIGPHNAKPISDAGRSVCGISESDFQNAFGFSPASKLSKDIHLRPLIQKFVTSSLGGEEPEISCTATDDWESRRWTARKCLVGALEKRVFSENQQINFNQFLDAFQTELKSVDSSFLRTTNTEQKVKLGPSDQTPKAISSVDAAAINAKQVKLLSEKGTIWHAASAFGTPSGQESWHTVRAVTALLRARGLDCPWMRGDERGSVGETPLHVALLFNAPGAAIDALVADLWELCPRLRDLSYTHELYRGENALHIAIIKRSGLPLIRRMVESPAGPALLAGRVTGTFFTDAACSAGACSSLGECPLAFAACTNQPAVFEYLVDHGADLEAVTSAGNNLLHLLVLNAGPATADAADAADAPDGDGAASDSIERAMMGMHGVVMRRAEAAGAYVRMRTARNSDGLTPLGLAAARGSRRASSGRRWREPPAPANTSSATPTRATAAPSPTAC